MRPMETYWEKMDLWKARRSAASAMKADGKTYDEIAAHFGISRQRAHQLVSDPIKQVAHSKVAAAVLHGKLPPLDGSIPCVDCGKPATCYDHRDYRKPLKVDPVCGGCNTSRGPGKVGSMKRRNASKERRAVRLHAAGQTMDDIAKKLRCTRKRVAQILNAQEAKEP